MKEKSGKVVAGFMVGLFWKWSDSSMTVFCYRFFVLFREKVFFLINFSRVCIRKLSMYIFIFVMNYQFIEIANKPPEIKFLSSSK